MERLYEYSILWIICNLQCIQNLEAIWILTFLSLLEKPAIGWRKGTERDENDPMNLLAHPLEMIKLKIIINLCQNYIQIKNRKIKINFNNMVSWIVNEKVQKLSTNSTFHYLSANLCKILYSKQISASFYNLTSSNWNIKSYNFHFYSFRMASKTYSKSQLKSLLEATEQQVLSKLLNPLDQNSQYFYQNFTITALKIFKYVNHFLNLINSHQDFGSLIDNIFNKLTESFNEYKSRNIFTHSAYSQQDHYNDDDEIYHFLNTRNNHIPVQCLNNYESQRQRLELEQFVQEMSKHSKINLKQPKRSLFLPKENTFKLKIGRKATFDTQLRCIEEEMTESKTYAPLQESDSQNQKQKQCNHVQIQTDFAIYIQDQQKRAKTAEIDMESQCESVPLFQQTLQNLSSRKQKIPSSKKKGNSKKKAQGDKGTTGKKKLKLTVSPSCISFKQSMQILNEHEEEQKQCEQKDSFKIGQCSIKSVNPFLNISKELDLAVIESQIVDNMEKNNPNLVYSVDELGSSKENYMYKQQTENNEINEQKKMQLNEDQKQEKSGLKEQIIDAKQQQYKNQAFQFEQNAQKQIISEKQQGQETYKNSFSKFSSKDRIKCHQITIGIQRQHQQRSSNSNDQYHKISISTVKIIQDAQFQQKMNNYENSTSQHHSYSRNDHIKNSKKRKIYTSSNRYFQSSIQKQDQKQNPNSFQKIKKCNFNVAQMQKLNNIKKQSYISNHKSSFAAKNDVSNISETPSQDYLISRQKSAKMQLKNKLIEIVKNQTKDERIYDEIQEKSNIKQISIKTSTKNSFNNSRQVSLINKTQNQPENRSLMTFFSNKLKTPQANAKGPIIVQSQKLSQNDKGFISVQKYSPSLETQQLRQNIKDSEINLVDEASKAHQIISNSLRNISNQRKYRQKQCKTVDPSPKKSIFYHKSSQMTSIKASMSKLKEDMRLLNSSQSHKKLIHSSSEHKSSQVYEFNDLKRKLRNRAYKDKLSQYLQLVETSHLKFCGKDCNHITELFKGKEGTASQQIIRLFKKLK